MPNYLITSDEVEELKKSIIGVVCNNKCQGTGVITEKVEGTLQFNDCKCVDDFKWHCGLQSANIPKKYWDFNLKDLLKKFVKENNVALGLIDGYSKQCDEMIKEGVGLYIQGTNGLAKTALSCYILKEFIKKEKRAYFIRMSRLTTLIFESMRDEGAKKKIDFIRKNVQILVIDEIEKDYKVDDTSSFSGVHVSEIFDDLYETKKCLIVTSNLPKKELGKIHSASVVDRLRELVDIPLIGETFRGMQDKKSIILKGMKNGD